MLIRDIVESARDRLGDADRTGWTDERLVRLVSAGQKDICKRSSVYRRIAFIGLRNYTTVYMLPTDCYDVVRLEYMGRELPIYSREDLSRLKTIPPMYAIKSNLNRGLIEIHPGRGDIVEFKGYIEGSDLEDEDIRIAPPEGVTASTTSKKMAFDSNLGVFVGMREDLSCHAETLYGDISGTNLFTDLNLAITDPLGVATNVKFETVGDAYGFLDAINGNYVNGTYGICTEALFDDGYVVVYYRALPPKVDLLEGSLVLEDVWESALVHYVVGMARQDDNDEGNYQLGEAELKKYMHELEETKKITSKSFTSQVSGVDHTIYRGFNRIAGGQIDERQDY